MDEQKEIHGDASVRLLPARFVPMTSDERAAAIAALAALLAYAHRNNVEEPLGDDVCSTADQTSTMEEPAA